MHHSASKLSGIFPALVTPFDKGNALDESLMVSQTKYLLNAGVNGFFLTGTTSEGAYLTTEERLKTIELILGVAGRTLPICVAMLETDTSSVMREIDKISSLEPDYISAITPLYIRVSQRDIIYHFTRIADSSPFPLILYNIPQNSHNTIALESILELVDYPNIAGIKDSSGNFIDFQKGLLSTGDKDFTWIMGEDLLDAAALFMGCPCIVTGLGNSRIEPYVLMYKAFVEGDAKGIIRQQARINSLAGILQAPGGKAISSIKYAAETMDRSSSRMRIASMELNRSEKDQVSKVLKDLGYI